MPTTNSNPPPYDQTLAQILTALQSIADAVNRGSEVIVDNADERQASQGQSTAIVDYLVLRELVGRQADGNRRTVGATRIAGKAVVFDGQIPANAAKAAVFTRRGIAPDEVADITVDDGPIVELVRKQRGIRRGSAGNDPIFGFALVDITDDQPIARIELRDAGDLAVALGPRLAPVS